MQSLEALLMNTNGLVPFLLFLLGWMVCGGGIGAWVAYKLQNPKILGFAWGSCLSFFVLIFGSYWISKTPWLNAYFHF